jgi:hypothetical protein
MRDEVHVLYSSQELVEFGPGARINSLVQTILLCDVQHDELGSRRGCKIDCEPEAMVRMVTKRQGKDNPARIVVRARREMRADRANGNLQTAYQLLGNGTDQKLA